MTEEEMATKALALVERAVAALEIAAYAMRVNAETAAREQAHRLNPAVSIHGGAA